MDEAKIKTLREKRKMTQKQAATAAGLSDARHWSNIERGHQKSRSISVDLLERIAHALGVEPCELLSKRKGAK